MNTRVITGMLFCLASVAVSTVLFGGGCSSGGGTADLPAAETERPSPTVQIDGFIFKSPAEILDTCQRGPDDSLDCAGLLRSAWCAPRRDGTGAIVGGGGDFALSDEFAGYTVNTDTAGRFVCVASASGRQG